MKKFLIFSLSAICLILAGCRNENKGNTIVVSIEPQRALLEEIAGDRFDIITMMTPGANPETFEPGIQAMRKFEGARAFLTTGHLPFEHKLEENLPSDVEAIDTSTGITPVFGTHDHGHDHHHDHAHGHNHENGDPHVWTSVKNAKIMVENIYETVIRLQPESKEYFTERYLRLKNRLDSLDTAFSTKLESAPTKSFAIWHPSLSYLARDYGLNQIAVGFENKEMPASTLRDVIEKARQSGARVFFFQKEFDSRQAESLNKEMGTNLITINPLAYEWESQLDSIVSALCR